VHLLIIIAFAALLWFNSATPMNLLNLPGDLSFLLVIGQVLLVALLALFTTRKTIKVLQHREAVSYIGREYHLPR